jgi:hypothetical protein
MTTNRLYFLLFGVPFLLMVLFAAIVSGGDLRFVGFAAEAAVVAIGAIALLALPISAWVNRWQTAPLEALAQAMGGEVVATVGGDRHLRIPNADGTVDFLFWMDTQEEAGAEERESWTCVGRERKPGVSPAVEVRMLPDGKRVTRWANRWWEDLGRGEPADPLTTPAAREAAELLASFSPGVESRLRFDGERIVFAVRLRERDPKVLGILATAAGQVLGRV